MQTQTQQIEIHSIEPVNSKNYSVNYVVFDADSEAVVSQVLRRSALLDYVIENGMNEIDLGDGDIAVLAVSTYLDENLQGVIFAYLKEHLS